MDRGKLAGIYIAAEKAGPLKGVASVRAVPGQGLEGDRYFTNSGTFSKEKRKPDAEVTLIEAEAIENLKNEGLPEVAANETRRNLLTRGVALNHLVGKEFSIGPVRLKGIKLCEPCGHLEKLTRPGVKNALLHRGGLRAQILVEGELAVGDAISA